MSRQNVGAEECLALGAAQRTLESYPNREVSLGALRVTRALPIRDRRMIGPWCFLDRFGPLSFGAEKPMDVAPHPHIGLQTVTWLLDGEVLHDDSLGSEATARPGGVNIMTAGAGIAHAEQTPRQNSGRLNGAQLWVALPEAVRGTAPSFQAIERVPVVESGAGVIQLFAGELGGAVSPGRHFSPLLGADLTIHPGATLEMPLDAAFEHALLVLDGDCAIDGQPLESRRLYYLGMQRNAIALRSGAGGRVMLLGGPPFPETILMWWNFVARTPEEIATARDDWATERRFGAVRQYRGPRLDAPALGRFARAEPVS